MRWDIWVEQCRKLAKRPVFFEMSHAFSKSARTWDIFTRHALIALQSAFGWSLCTREYPCFPW